MSDCDQIVEKATPDSSGEANWASIIEINDKAGQSSSNAKDYLKSVMKRLGHSSKNVQMHTITLLDSCVLNCGSIFHKEVATPDFVQGARSFLEKASPDAADKFKEHLQKWSENEFKTDSKLSVIPTFYQALRSEGAYFGMGKSSTKATSSSSSASGFNSAESDLAAAIALSLKETAQSKAQTSSIYPQMSNLSSQPANSTISSNNYSSSSSQPSGRQVRALYDFEAVEENELTFKTGDLITVLDDSDPNWWKGSTWRGEGLFPVNFVTTDLTPETAPESAGANGKKTVQFNEEAQVEHFDPDSVQIDEEVIDQALDQIQNSDPTGLTEDSPDMLHLEEECKVMGPLIDQELEQIDAAHNDLMNLNQKLADAFQLYTRLMQEGASAAQYAPVAPSGYAAPQMTSTMPTGRLPSQQQTLPIGVGAGAPNPYSSYNPYLELSQQPQTYYNPNTYNHQSQPMMSTSGGQEQLPNYIQATTLQQYQMSGASMNSLQNIPSVIDPNMESMSLGYTPGNQPSYHHQMPPQHLS